MRYTKPLSPTGPLTHLRGLTAEAEAAGRQLRKSARALRAGRGEEVSRQEEAAVYPGCTGHTPVLLLTRGKDPLFVVPHSGKPSRGSGWAL